MWLGKVSQIGEDKYCLYYTIQILIKYHFYVDSEKTKIIETEKSGGYQERRVGEMGRC